MARKRLLMKTPRLSQAKQEQLSCFKEKCGREPEPDDFLFLDPYSDTPIPLTEEKMRADFLAAAKDVGISDPKLLELLAALFDDESTEIVAMLMHMLLVELRSHGHRLSLFGD